MVLFRQQLQQQQQQLMLTSSTHPIVEELPQENISTDGTKNTTRSGGDGGGNGTAVDPQELKSAISHLDVTGGTRKSTPSEKASELVIPVPAKISTAAQAIAFPATLKYAHFSFSRSDRRSAVSASTPGGHRSADDCAKTA
jgi:hypothetical protein